MSGLTPTQLAAWRAYEFARTAVHAHQPIMSWETEERVRRSVKGLVVFVKMAKEYE